MGRGAKVALTAAHNAFLQNIIIDFAPWNLLVWLPENESLPSKKIYELSFKLFKIWFERLGVF